MNMTEIRSESIQEEKAPIIPLEVQEAINQVREQKELLQKISRDL